MKFNRFFVLSFFAIAFAFVYINILPYKFPNQYQPTAEDLSKSGFYDRSLEKGVWHGQDVLSYEIPRPDQLAYQVLGDNDGSNKRIEVDLSTQHVYAFEGDNRVYDFTVSTGKWGRTPTGEFRIGYKTRSTKMSGGSSALGTYYYLPNVPFVQFFGNSQIPWGVGFSFHGTYWHSNFGHPMSHGCINMRTEDAEKLFYWTGDKTGNIANGTRVVIYGITPAS